jgi:hypothetical protein
MGDDKPKVIAAELITQVRKSVTIDWNLRETARARIRVLVKRILNKWGYPPDLQEKAVKTVLMQAELLCGESSDNHSRWTSIVHPEQARNQEPDVRGSKSSQRQTSRMR